MTGWFRRSMGGYVILKELTSTGGVLRAHPYFWQALLSSSSSAPRLRLSPDRAPVRRWAASMQTERLEASAASGEPRRDGWNPRHAGPE